MLASAHAAGFFHFLAIEDFWRDAAVDHFLDQDAVDGFDLHFGAGEDFDFVFGEFDFDVGVFEVVAVYGFFFGLFDGVFEFLEVEFYGDVHCVIFGHGRGGLQFTI